MDKAAQLARQVIEAEPPEAKDFMLSLEPCYMVVLQHYAGAWERYVKWNEDYAPSDTDFDLDLKYELSHFSETATHFYSEREAEAVAEFVRGQYSHAFVTVKPYYPVNEAEELPDPKEFMLRGEAPGYVVILENPEKWFIKRNDSKYGYEIVRKPENATVFSGLAMAQHFRDYVERFLRSAVKPGRFEDSYRVYVETRFDEESPTTG